MATQGVPLWSTTAASNATADPAVNFAEGQAPSSVNDSARALMASVAKWRDDLYGLTTSGTSTAYTVTTNATYASAAVMSGAVFTIIPNATSGAAPTLAVDGLTARALNSSTGVAVPTGSLVSGTPYLIKYVHATTEFIVLGVVAALPGLSVSGVIALGNGTVLLPAYTFGSDTDCGWYHIGADNLGCAVNGAKVLDVSTAGLNVVGTISANGAALSPLPQSVVMVNGTIGESNGSSAATFAIKTLAGTDPSASDPVYFTFRNVTAGTGNYSIVTLTAALSLTISSGSTMGFSNTTAGRLWFAIFNDAGTPRLAAINCRSGSNLYPLAAWGIASSTAEGGAGGADTAQLFYTGTAVTSKAYGVIGYATYESGLVTAGTWNSSPTRIQLLATDTKLPGELVQIQQNATGAVATGTTTIPLDDTIPDQSTDGNSFMTQAITPTSAANLLFIETQAHLSNSAGTHNIGALFQDSTPAALAAAEDTAATSIISQVKIYHAMLAGTTSATTFKLYGGTATAGTTTFNGTSGSRLFGGALNSYLVVREIMA